MVAISSALPASRARPKRLGTRGRPIDEALTRLVEPIHFCLWNERFASRLGPHRTSMAAEFGAIGAVIELLGDRFGG